MEVSFQVHKIIKSTKHDTIFFTAAGGVDGVVVVVGEVAVTQTNY